MLSTLLIALAAGGTHIPGGAGNTVPSAGATPGPAAVADLGPSDMNWVIGPGETVIFNTSSGVINGQVFLGGVVNVNSLHVADQAILKIEGPNPFVLTTWGGVTIDGRIDLGGTSNPGVTGLNSTQTPEPGAPGQAGGGHGGTGSPLTTNSSPMGGAGFGAFQTPGGGGGGETGWSNWSAINGRRGAGGGGGRFGPDVLAVPAVPGLFEQSIIGLDAEPGFANTLADNGALSGPGGIPQGGVVGSGPFVDGDPGNDFYGEAFDRVTQSIVIGELKTPWAGAGGGGGGDASKVKSGQSFPNVPFKPTGDEKGAGGGGGAGSMHVLAMGPIVFGPSGAIRANGGTGGGGENTIFLNRVGGGSGGGSGGHVVLETASYVDFTSKSASSPDAVRAKGGQGGAGAGDEGGAYLSGNGMKETTPKKDACPLGQQVGGCRSPVDGAGGDGSPGLVQLHAPNGSAGILLPPGLTLGQVVTPSPVCSDGTCHLLPFAIAPEGSVFGVAARRLRQSLRWRLERGGALRIRR